VLNSRGILVEQTRTALRDIETWTGTRPALRIWTAGIAPNRLCYSTISAAYGAARRQMV
jgi:hypothetical protein